MTSCKRRLGRALILGALVTIAAAAHAEPPDAEKRAAAQALFDAGRALESQNDYAAGCPKLLESYRLDPAMGTKFYLAECYEHVGRLASAWTYYLEVVEQAHQEGAKDREKFANQRVEALKPRLPRLVVKPAAAVRGLAGLSIQRDGIAMGEGTWDTPVPVDLGEHTIHVTATDKKPLDLHVDVKQEGAEVGVEIPALEALPAAPADSGSATVAPPVEPPPPPPSPVQRIAGISVGVAGLVGLGAGIGLGVQAISKKKASNADGHCDASNACDAIGHQLRIDGLHAATASTVLFAVGGAALVAGVVLVATAPSKKKPADSPSASLSVGPLGVSLHGKF